MGRIIDLDREPRGHIIPIDAFVRATRGLPQSPALAAPKRVSPVAQPLPTEAPEGPGITDWLRRNFEQVPFSGSDMPKKTARRAYEVFQDTFFPNPTPENLKAMGGQAKSVLDALTQSPIEQEFINPPGVGETESRIKPNLNAALATVMGLTGGFKGPKLPKSPSFKGRMPEPLEATRFGQTALPEAPAPRPVAAEVVSGAKPLVVKRIEEPGVKPSTPDKPQGLYTTPAHLESPRAELGGDWSYYEVEPRRILEVPAEVSDTWVEHSRFGRGSKGPASTGINALRLLVSPSEFESLLRTEKYELQQRFAKEYPSVDWKRYSDTWEMLEGYAGLKARESGYDVLVQIDRRSPEFSEVVVLSEDSLRRIEKPVTPNVTPKPLTSEPAPSLEARPPEPVGPAAQGTLPTMERDAHAVILDEIVAMKARAKETGVKVRGPGRAKGPLVTEPPFEGVPPERSIVLRESEGIVPPEPPGPADLTALAGGGEGGGAIAKWQTPRWYRWKEPTEQLLAMSKDVKIPVGMIRHAMGEALERSPAMSRLQQFFNTPRAWIDPVRKYGLDTQGSWLATSRYNTADRQRINAIATGLTGMVVEAAGKVGALGEEVPELASAYKGPRGAVYDPHIGTVENLLRMPESYNLTPKWREFVNTWKEVFDKDLALTQRMGAKSGEVEGAYVTQVFKDPEKAKAAMSKAASPKGKGKPGVFQHRKLETPAEFYAFALENNLEVESDVLSLAYRRLAATSKVRGEIVFMDSLARKTGGGRVTTVAAEHGPGQKVVTRRGMRWVIEAGAGDEAESILAPGMRQADERAVKRAVEEAKNAFLSLDASIIGMRQGLLGFVADPIGWVKAMAHTTQAMFTAEGEAIFLAQEAEDLIRAGQAGLENITPFEVPTKALGAEHPPLIEKVPGVAWLNKQQFANFLPKMKFYSWRNNVDILQNLKQDQGLAGLIHKMPGIGPVAKRLSGNISKMTDAEIDKVAADAANNWIGGVERATYQVREFDALRQILVLVENWTRAQTGILINAPKLTPKGVLARRLVFQELAFGTFVAAGVAAATGQEIIFDPRSRKWNKIKIPNVGYVSIMPHASLYRMAAQALGGVPKGEFGAAKNAFTERLNALWSGLDAKTGQFVHMGVDLVRGTDYQGRPIGNKAKYIATELAPIPAGNALEQLRTESAASAAIASGIGVSGASFSSLPMSERMGALAEKQGVAQGRKWEDLNAQEQKVVELSEEGKTLRAKGGLTAAQRRRDVTYQEVDEMKGLAERWERGEFDDEGGTDQFRKQLSSIRERAAAKKEMLENGKERARPADPMEAAVHDYYNLFKQWPEGAGRSDGSLDYEIFEELLAGLEKGWTPEMRQYVDENTGVLRQAAPPIIREYMGFTRFLRKWGWYDMWQGVLKNTNDPMLQQLYPVYREERAKGGGEKFLTEMGGEVSKKITDFENAVENARKANLAKNPKIDAAMVKFYGTTPQTAQGKLIKYDRTSNIFKAAVTGLDEPDWRVLDAKGYRGIEGLEKLAKLGPVGLASAASRISTNKALRHTVTPERVRKERWVEQIQEFLEAFRARQQKENAA